MHLVHPSFPRDMDASSSVEAVAEMSEEKRDVNSTDKEK
jgi:hypothetical protein